MEYIEGKVFKPRIDQFSPLDINHLTSDNPIIKPITIEWQKEKCNFLDIPFHQQIDQHSGIAGQKLRYFEPWNLDTIAGDGNCLFRCLSKNCFWE